MDRFGKANGIVAQIEAVYLCYADKYVEPLASRLSEVNRPLIMTQNRFSTPRPPLLDDI